MKKGSKFWRQIVTVRLNVRTHGRTNFLNNSTAHSKEPRDFEKCQSKPTTELNNSKKLKKTQKYKQWKLWKISYETDHAPNRQVVHGTSFQPNWWKDVSAETTNLKNNPTGFLSEISPQSVCEHIKMTEESLQYKDDELSSSQSLYIIKNTKVRT